MRLIFILLVFILTHLVHSQNQNLEKDLFFLSQDSMQGILVGSTSEKLCADYLAEKFISFGLTPLFKDSYFQDFETFYNSNPHDTISSNFLSIKSRNVVGFLDNNASKTFIIGAHYDHIGRNEYHNSLEYSEANQIHNGADDNASGVAGVLELAREFALNKIKEEANFIFVCFSGEEIGLVGSKKFADTIKKIKNIDFMLNMDMIGRMDSLNHLYVGGVGSSPIFNEIITSKKPSSFNLVIDSSGVGPSDHSSFYFKNIPVLFFFTGSHEDYHKPSDDYEKINFKSLNQILTYIKSIVNELSQHQTIQFTATRSKINSQKSAFSVTMGILPNYSNFGDGLHIDHVFENRPAANAGIQVGDIIIELNDLKITDIYSYMDCLSTLKKGDKAKVVFKRKEKIMTSEIKF